jgi:general stress protein YciG
MAKRKKPMTVSEMASKGGKARAKKYPKEKLQEWARKGGWPKGRPRKTSKPKETKGGE